MTASKTISEALKLPRGARFFKSALQVNPFAYVQRHSKKTAFTSEKDYNEAIVSALKANVVEVIAITDHQCSHTGVELAQLARSKGIVVFPGAELETKDGVHFLCLFDPSTSAAKVSGILGDCGIHDQQKPPATIKYDCHELVEKAGSFGCQFVAAHVVSEKGLLRVLDNQARAGVWKLPGLMSCSLPAGIDVAPANYRPILENKNAEYKRERSIAILNAQDISSPEDIAEQGATCWIKMSEVTVQGLRQAFLDPTSRIRLASDPIPEEHVEFVALSWQGGFLDGASIHFNENLNVLVGGRGTGKSTIVESIRYALGLDPLGDDARMSNDGIVTRVLRSGTKISLWVKVYRPACCQYLIERTIPNAPVVRDDTGALLNLKPSDILPDVEIFGQHEISELSKSPERRTSLLNRFIEDDPSLSRKKADLISALERSRTRLLAIAKERAQIDERMNQMPALEATLAQYKKAGLEDKLREQSLLVREESVLTDASSKIKPFKDILNQLRKALPIDIKSLSSESLAELPGKAILSPLEAAVETLSKQLGETAAQMATQIETCEKSVVDVYAQWKTRRDSVDGEYQRILRELQKDKIDGAEFIKLRKQIEELRPLGDRLQALHKEATEREVERRAHLVEWEDARAAEFRQLERAAKKVTRKLEGRVRVEVIRSGDRQLLITFLEDKLGGRLAETKESLKKQGDLSVATLVETCRAGKDALVKIFGLPGSQAERLSAMPKEVLFEMEEIDLPATTSVKLNVAAEGQPEQWQTLEELSTGQKATAILLLLLLESLTPLVVDQPEDDLDNRFITEGIVPKMKEEKRRRQFIFATHNANIPVLGDAELIVGLSASGDADSGKARIPAEHMGSIDSNTVRHLVEEVLEGGKDAFEMRRLKYGF